MFSLPTITLPKPKFGDPCNGCGYCCTVEPCMLAEDFLNCSTGPCVALEHREGRFICGLVRNPLAYLYQAAHPDQEVPVHEEATDSVASRDLSATIASALGVGLGCDASDDQDDARMS